MKLKYYLRGLGIGIIVTTVILAVSFSKKEIKMSDEEIMARAAQLGMVMQETETTEQGDTEQDPDGTDTGAKTEVVTCLLYTSPSPRDPKTSRMPSSA